MTEQIAYTDGSGVVLVSTNNPLPVKQENAGWKSNASKSFSWQTGFGPNDLNGLSADDYIMSSVVIDNSVERDSYMSLGVTLSSFTPSASDDTLLLYMAPLGPDGVSYGGGLVPGVQASSSDQFDFLVTQVAIFEFPAGITRAYSLTALAAYENNNVPVFILPEKFRLVAFKRFGNPLPASNNQVYYKTFSL